MILCQNLKKEDLQRIGSDIAGAFLGEKGCFAVLPRNIADKLFTIIAETCYESGHLYTTSENHEGYCVYWTKKERPGFLPQLKMLWKMATKLPLKTGLLLKNAQNHWTPTEKRYKKQENYVEVFLLAVRKEYQGKGYFRAMLQEPFALAEKRNTICVLDTDSDVKAAKYCHVGLHIVDSREQKSGITMYALEK